MDKYSKLATFDNKDLFEIEEPLEKEGADAGKDLMDSVQTVNIW